MKEDLIKWIATEGSPISNGIVTIAGMTFGTVNKKNLVWTCRDEETIEFPTLEYARVHLLCAAREHLRYICERAAE
jgi:hypothetical protein